MDGASSAGVERLIRCLGLPPAYQAGVDRVVRPLATEVEQRYGPHNRVPVIGIAGSQGSGKSTLVRFLTELVGGSVALSLDDFYLTARRRQLLAGDVHPLFGTRGPPGTHDVDLARQTILRLQQSNSHQTTKIPVFAKDLDDRLPTRQWRVWRGRPSVIFFEGWCVGCPPQSATQLLQPINSLERAEDGDLAWRSAINEQLRGPYRNLFKALDALVFLKVPGMRQVLAWRAKAGAAHVAGRSATKLETDAGFKRFVAHYERLTRHMLEVMPETADAVIHVAPDHAMTALLYRPDGAFAR